MLELAAISTQPILLFCIPFRFSLLQSCFAVWNKGEAAAGFTEGCVFFTGWLQFSLVDGRNGFILIPLSLPPTPVVDFYKKKRNLELFPPTLQGSFY